MPLDLARAVSSLAALLAVSAVGAPAVAATSGANGTHDPSRIIESNGKFYFCSTGGGCASSSDGLVWKSTGLHIPIPSWSTTYTNVPGYSGNQGIWAPDIIFYDNKYYIYYSFCAQPATHAPCTIGLYTTPTLDSTAAGYKLTDMGKVVTNPVNATGYQFSTIDPAPVIDAAGSLWSSWGSGYGKDTSKLQIYVTHMAEIGLPLTTDPVYAPPMTLGYGLETGAIEGSYLHYRNGYYYLFWNSGGCCSGASSTYTVHVARSQTISGPYTGAQIWYSSTGSIHGPGHVGIYNACGVERFTYHYYPDSGGSVLGENELSWSADGWPVVGPQSTTALVPCGNPTNTGGGSGGSDNGGASGVGGGGAGGSGGVVDVAGNGGALVGSAGGDETGGMAVAGFASAGGGTGGASNGGAESALGGSASSNAGSAGLSSAGASALSGGPGQAEPSDPGQDSGCAISPSKKGHADYRWHLIAAAALAVCLRRKRK